MFSLLSPFALWLAPLIAAPLVIHFLGRVQPKLLDFPSLMLVRGRLANAMRRHRLKNWLQLLLRTLILLLLVLAATNPMWRPRHGFAPPVAAGILLHNGAYASCPLFPGTPEAAEKKLRHSLDSLTAGHCHAVTLITDVMEKEPAARFGRYADALPNLLRAGDGLASYDLVLPVFDWRDLEANKYLLLHALQKNPALRMLLIEFPKAAAGLTPFQPLTLAFPKEGMASLRTRLRDNSARNHKAYWTPTHGSPREISLPGDSAAILLPLPPSGWVSGEFSLPVPSGEAPFAYPSVYASLQVPPASRLCHLGDPFASLASLGKTGNRIQVQSFSTPQELGSQKCDLLYLADPKDVDATLLEQAAEIARGGGKVILGVGPNSDPALWNRNLLEPLRIGKLTALDQHVSAPVQTRAQACAQAGWNISGWGEPGTVQTQIDLLPDSGTSVLLTAENNPILVYRRVGAGAILLWTTDVDDPTWTDVGLGPWVALAHQAFAAGSWSHGLGLQSVASDSTFLVTTPEENAIQVTDPQGNVFPRVFRDPSGWRVGPFDKLGLYRIVTHSDTLQLAVGLAENRLEETSRLRWRADRARFLSELGDLSAQVEVRDADAIGKPLYGGNRWRQPLLLLAALLLLLEGAISLRLTPAQLAGSRE